MLIENQLESSDHTHLGQILTYLAGLEAQTVVWIAQHFEEDTFPPFAGSTRTLLPPSPSSPCKSRSYRSAIRHWHRSLKYWRSRVNGIVSFELFQGKIAPV